MIKLREQEEVMLTDINEIKGDFDIDDLLDQEQSEFLVDNDIEESDIDIYNMLFS